MEKNETKFNADLIIKKSDLMSKVMSFVNKQKLNLNRIYTENVLIKFFKATS